MAVRNFWIEANIDGRKTELSGGPRAKDGGFELTVYIRQRGSILRAMHVRGTVKSDGSLNLAAVPSKDAENGASYVSTKSGGIIIETER